MRSLFSCIPLLALSIIASPVANLVARDSVTVHFIETASTYYGENIFVVGGISELGNWSPDNAIKLSPANYPDWDAYITIPSNTRFEYKFIRKGSDGGVTWEFDPLLPNRVFTTGSSGTATVSSSFNNRATTVDQSSQGGGSGSGSGGPIEANFSLLATTYYGENIYLVGSIDALGNWDTSRAILLSAADYPTWKITVQLPASTSFEFKFFRLGSDGRISWEFDSQGAAGNRRATTPSSGTFFFAATYNGESTISTSGSMTSTSTSTTATTTSTTTTPTITSTSTTTTSSSVSTMTTTTSTSITSTTLSTPTVTSTTPITSTTSTTTSTTPTITSNTPTTTATSTTPTTTSTTTPTTTSPTTTTISTTTTSVLTTPTLTSTTTTTVTTPTTTTMTTPTSTTLTTTPTTTTTSITTTPTPTTTTTTTTSPIIFSVP